jgi:hypothetical protein
VDPFGEFKFEIGQMVRHRTGTEKFERPMVIVARVLEQCPGGTQRFYKVAVSRMDTYGTGLMQEIELDPYHER